MPHFPHHPHGQFAWVEVHAADQAATEALYPDLFGWKVTRHPLGDGTHYTLFMKQGQPVAGCVQMDKAAREAGTRNTWNNYVAVDNVRELVGRVASCGGRVLVAPRRFSKLATMALVCGPDGAEFGLWEGDELPGAGICNEPGSFSWNELVTDDREGARAFLGDLMGWTFEDQQEGPEFIYTAFFNNGRRNGGIMALEPSWGEGARAFWMPYFAVSVMDASLAKIEQLGGRVLRGPINGRPGHWNVVGLPSGEIFTLIALTGGSGPGPDA